MRGSRRMAAEAVILPSSVSTAGGNASPEIGEKGSRELNCGQRCVIFFLKTKTCSAFKAFHSFPGGRCRGPDRSCINGKPLAGDLKKKEHRCEMKHYDFFLSYSRQDVALAGKLVRALEKRGYSCFFDMSTLIAGSFLDQLTDAMRNVEGFLVLLTPNALSSRFVAHEIRTAFDIAQSRAKRIVPLYVDGTACESAELMPLLSYKGLVIQTSKAGWPAHAVDGLLELDDWEYRRDKRQKYELFSELKRNRLFSEAEDKLVDICYMIMNSIDFGKSLYEQYGSIIEMDRCLGELHTLYAAERTEGDRQKKKTAFRKLELIRSIRSRTLGSSEYDTALVTDPPGFFFICWMIRLYYLDEQIRYDCMDVIIEDGGPADLMLPYLPDEEYIEKHRNYQDVYGRAGAFPDEDMPEQMRAFVRDTECYSGRRAERIPDTSLRKPGTPDMDKKLETVAKYIHDGNRVFEAIGRDEKAADFVKCLITSYERLRDYCLEIGARELSYECILRITELKDKLQKCEGTEEKEHTVAEKGIRALLGFTRPGIGDYDVFISHRKHDSDIALTVYDFLKDQMKEVFLDIKSLSGELHDSDYKNAIFLALDKCRHFVVVITDLKELAPGYRKHEKDYMQQEMDVFHSEWFENRKKGGNFIILVTDDVYDQIVSANKTNIDLKWRRVCLIRIRDFRKEIGGYVKA